MLTNCNQEKSLSNQSRIFRFIYKHEKVAKQDISAALELSLPTVTQNLKALEDLKLITEDGEFKSKGGRKAKAITYIKDSKYAIGLDIINNHIGIVLVNMAGEIIEHTRFKKPFVRSHEYFQSIGEMIDKFVQEQDIPEDKILGVGVSVPGILDESGKKIVYLHTLGVSNMECSEISEFISYPCIFCHAANAGSVAEMWKKEAECNVAYFFLSNNIGGSIIINNQLYLGNNQRSAEFGHMNLVRNGRQCYCGKHGCMDAYCAANLLTNSSLGTSSLEEFFIKLDNGDEKCQAFWDEYLDYMAIAVNNVRMLLDCDVILGSYIGSYMEEHIQTLREKVSKLNPFEENAQYVKACSYKIEASAVGAALLNIEEFINQL